MSKVSRHGRSVEPADEMRRRRAHGERADEDADREPATFAEPGGDDLHRRRVRAGQADAGREPERERRPEARRPRGRARRWSPRPDDAEVISTARREDVREIDERAGQRADDEARLDGDGEPGGAAVGQLPFPREGGQDRGGAEPERQGEQLGEGEQRELAPGWRHAWCRYSTTFFRFSSAISVAVMPRSFSTSSVCSLGRPRGADGPGRLRQLDGGAELLHASVLRVIDLDDHVPVEHLRILDDLLGVVHLAHADVGLGEVLVPVVAVARLDDAPRSPGGRRLPRRWRRARTGPGVRAKRTKSGRPMALQKFSQSQGSVQPMVRSLPSRVS